MPSSFHSTAAGPPAFSSAVGDVGRRAGQHRLQRHADHEPDAGEPVLALLQRDAWRRPAGRRAAAARAAPRPAAGRRPSRRRRSSRPPARPGAARRPAARARKRLLGVGRAAEQVLELAPPLRLRPGAGRAPDGVERLVHLVDGQRRLGRRRREVAQRGPAHADLALQQVAGQVGDDGRHLVGRRPAAAAPPAPAPSAPRAESERTRSAVAVRSASSIPEWCPTCLYHRRVLADGRIEVEGVAVRRVVPDVAVWHARVTAVAARAPGRLRRGQRARDGGARRSARGGRRERRDLGRGHRRRSALGAGQAEAERLGGQRPRRRTDRPRRRRRGGPGRARRGRGDAGGTVLRDRRGARDPRRAARRGRARRARSRRGDGGCGRPPARRGGRPDRQPAPRRRAARVPDGAHGRSRCRRATPRRPSRRRARSSRCACWCASSSSASAPGRSIPEPVRYAVAGGPNQVVSASRGPRPSRLRPTRRSRRAGSARPREPRPRRAPGSSHAPA